MCGIAGFCGDFDRALLEAMNGIISRRGPDDSGAVFWERQALCSTVGLAHRRLSIVDLSPRGHQPMPTRCTACGGQPATESQGLWLTYNGEIYNAPSLRRELESLGHGFVSTSDTEVLLHLYAEHGPDMLGMLNGIFAFALYDGRQRGRPEGSRVGDVLLARDGLGVKPLYYARTTQGVLFASELKALLQSDAVSRELDPVAIHEYMSFLWAPAPSTPLTGVRKVEPGEAMILRDGGIARRWNHYTLPQPTGDAPGTLADSALSLERTLLDAVERQLLSDVQIGAFLSGGLDSSAIIALMKRLRPDDPIPCYCIDFTEGGGVDGHVPDAPYAQQVAQHLGTDLQVMRVGDDLIDHLEELIYFLDEPQADPAPLNALMISRQARRDGIKVLMSGAGGDDILSGYRRHRAIALDGAWERVPRLVRRPFASAARVLLDGHLPVAGLDAPAPRAAARILAYADMTAEHRLMAYYCWNSDAVRRNLMSAELGARLADTDVTTPLRRTLADLPSDADPLSRMLRLETRHFLPDHNLNYTDKVSMAAGVEVRVPLIDREVVAWAARCPSRFKLRDGETKAVFKKAMEPYLPHSVIYRPKSGFGAPMRRWIKQGLRPLVDEVLSPKSLRARGLFDPKAVERLVRRDRARFIDASYLVFSLVCIELWCRQFVDRRPELPNSTI